MCQARIGAVTASLFSIQADPCGEREQAYQNIEEIRLRPAVLQAADLGGNPDDDPAHGFDHFFQDCFRGVSGAHRVGREKPIGTVIMKFGAQDE